MRALLMVGNNNLSLRELYTTVLDSHAPGWTAAFMSAMPSSAESIVGGFDLVIYELGRPDVPERVSEAVAIRKAGVDVLTHVEGRNAEDRARELQAAGVIVVRSPVTGAHISESLDRIMAARRTPTRRTGVIARVRHAFGGGEVHNDG